MYLTGVTWLYLVKYLSEVTWLHLVKYLTGVTWLYLVRYLTGASWLYLVGYLIDVYRNALTGSLTGVNKVWSTWSSCRSWREGAPPQLKNWGGTLICSPGCTSSGCRSFQRRMNLEETGCTYMLAARGTTTQSFCNTQQSCHTPHSPIIHHTVLL